MNLPPLVRELLGSALSSIFDPSQVSFRAADEAGVGPVRTACRTPEGNIHHFRRPLNRNAFLCGCLEFTENECIEHLIVGFGDKHASTTRIAAATHCVGSQSNVTIPPGIRQAIHEHISRSFKSEVLIFHNHPPNWLNALCDNLPLPSAPDRHTLLAHLLQPFVAIKALIGGGRVRCYLGENGFVREFRTSDLLTLIQTFAKARGQQP